MKKQYIYDIASRFYATFGTGLCLVHACTSTIAVTACAEPLAPSISVQYRSTTGQSQRIDNNLVLQSMLPIPGMQSPDWVTFLDTRFKKSFQSFDEINIGLASRYRISSDAWLGGYVFTDRMKVQHSGLNGHLNQLTVGMESLNRHHIGRFNVYLPIGSPVWNDKSQIFMDIGSKKLVTERVGRAASKGFDVEWGPRWQGDRVAVHAFGGGSWFNTQGKPVRKARVGLTTTVAANKFLPQLDVYSRAEKSLDRDRFGKRPVSFHIGISARFYPTGAPKKPLDVVHTPIERDVNIVTHQVVQKQEKSFSLGSSSRVVDSHGTLKVQGNQIVGKDGKTVPLKGISHFWINEHWGGEAFCTEETVEQMVKLGVDVFRVPVGVEEGNTGILDYPTQVRQRMKTVVEAAIKHGKYVIIDWHSHKAQDYTKESIDFFSEMAETYKNVPNVIFEVYNEPVGGTDWQTVKTYNEQVTSAIRSKGANNLIIVGTPTWSQDVDIAARDRVSDTNSAYALHFYAGTHHQGLRDKAQYALDAGVPLFISECGGVHAWGGGDFDHHEWDQWMKFIDTYNIPTVFWHMGNTQKYETSSAIWQDVSPQGPWSSGDLTGSGQAFVDAIGHKK